VDHGEIFAGRHIVRELHTIIKSFAVDHDLRAKILGPFDFIKRGAFGHDDGGFDAKPFRMIGDALRVVPSAARDHAVRAVFGRECQELGQRTTGLERVGVLEVLKLEVKVDPQLLGQPRSIDRGCEHGRIADRVMRRTDRIKGQGHGRVLCGSVHELCLRLGCQPWGRLAFSSVSGSKGANSSSDDGMCAPVLLRHVVAR